MSYSSTKNISISVLLLILTFITATGSTSDRLYFDEYTYSGISLDISNETANARATTWKPDGTLVFITGRYTENVVSYELTNPWDLSTASFSDEFDLSNQIGSSTQNSVAHGLFLHRDGKLMWVFNRTEIWGFSLETPWDLSTVTHSSYANLVDFVERGHDFDFNPDGTLLFIDDRNARAVHQFSLSTPWDITSIQWDYTLDISDQEIAVRGLEMILDGTIMLLLDTGRQAILQYQLSEPYNLRTANYLNAFDVSSESSNPRGLSIRPDLDSFYVTENSNQKIYQYNRKK